jgi:hypothetical protein
MNYEEYKAKAMALYNKPVGANLPTQLFDTGQIVKVAEDLGEDMAHFQGRGCIAVIEYTYGQKYGGSNVDNYSLLILNEDLTPKGLSAWYLEHQLTLVDEDCGLGLLILKDYQLQGK